MMAFSVASWAAYTTRLCLTAACATRPCPRTLSPVMQEAMDPGASAERLVWLAHQQQQMGPDPTADGFDMPFDPSVDEEAHLVDEDLPDMPDWREMRQGHGQMPLQGYSQPWVPPGFEQMEGMAQQGEYGQMMHPDQGPPQPLFDAQDMHEMCQSWAMSGECSLNPDFMQMECLDACGNLYR